MTVNSVFRPVTCSLICPSLFNSVLMRCMLPIFTPHEFAISLAVEINCPGLIVIVFPPKYAFIGLWVALNTISSHTALYFMFL